MTFSKKFFLKSLRSVSALALSAILLESAFITPSQAMDDERFLHTTQKNSMDPNKRLPPNKRKCQENSENPASKRQKTVPLDAIVLPEEDGDQVMGSDDTQKNSMDPNKRLPPNKRKYQENSENPASKRQKIVAPDAIVLPEEDGDQVMGSDENLQQRKITTATATPTALDTLSSTTTTKITTVVTTTTTTYLSVPEKIAEPPYSPQGGEIEDDETPLPKKMQQPNPPNKDGNGAIDIRSPEGIKRLEELASAGYSSRQIAPEFQVSYKVVQRVMNDNGIKSQAKPNPPNKDGNGAIDIRSPEGIQRLKELASTGLSSKQIAPEFGVSSKTVQRVMNDNGIKKAQVDSKKIPQVDSKKIPRLSEEEMEIIKMRYEYFGPEIPIEDIQKDVQKDVPKAHPDCIARHLKYLKKISSIAVTLPAQAERLTKLNTDIRTPESLKKLKELTYAGWSLGHIASEFKVSEVLIGTLRKECKLTSEVRLRPEHSKKIPRLATEEMATIKMRYEHFGPEIPIADIQKDIQKDVPKAHPDRVARYLQCLKESYADAVAPPAQATRTGTRLNTDIRTPKNLQRLTELTYAGWPKGDIASAFEVSASLINTLWKECEIPPESRLRSACGEKIPRLEDEEMTTIKMRYEHFGPEIPIADIQKDVQKDVPKAHPDRVARYLQCLKKLYGGSEDEKTADGL